MARKNAIFLILINVAKTPITIFIFLKTAPIRGQYYFFPRSYQNKAEIFSYNQSTYIETENCVKTLNVKIRLQMGNLFRKFIIFGAFEEMTLEKNVKKSHSNT